jgi:peptidoglycan/LPS O-acetylase OafA/YrhL
MRQAPFYRESLARGHLAWHHPRMTTPPASARIHGLDTLRAAAIVLVLLHHYVLFVSGASTFGWLGDMGWAGVDLFFALSGYLIGNQIFAAMRSAAGFSPGRFYARRLVRTLPNFYVVLALYALWPAFRGEAMLPPLWRFLTFTQNINLDPGTAFSHAWSLCIEEQFYLLLPALALWLASRADARRRTWAVLGLAFGAGMLLRAFVWDAYVDDAPQGQHFYYKYIYYSSFCRFDELVAGVGLALLKNYHAPLWQRLTAHGNALLAAGAALTALAFALFMDDHLGFAMTVFGYPLLALAFSLLIVAALSSGSLLHRLRVPGAASIALWSYATYLIHKQVFVLAAAPLLALGYGPATPVAIAASLALGVLAGYLLYRLVEAPCMALRKRYLPAVAAR